MKAAVVEAPGRLVVRDVPEPSVGPYQARCQMLFGAVCTGTDTHILHATLPWKIAYPTVLGHESVGRVVEIGESVRHLKVGDVVTRIGTLPTPELGTTWGGFVEWGIAHDFRAMQEDGLHEAQWGSYQVQQVVPEDISPAEATMMITWRETWSYIRRMGVTAGSRVLVLGSGGNGLAFAAHARNLEASRVTIVGQGARLQTARDVGASHAEDYRDSTWTEREALALPDGYDFIIDAVGRQGMLDGALPLLSNGGTAGIYGIDDAEHYQIHPGRARGSFTIYNGGYSEGESHDDIVRLMREKRLEARHWLNVDAPFALDDIAQAFEDLSARRLVKALIRL
ncbi:MAG TPA: alcohol dehydrogenase catalytic domain-containing protein [Abditibacteriaceae bacterium]|jgi:L-iditol 2-dehydrogenase/alcohol dehydrogenase